MVVCGLTFLFIRFKQLKEQEAKRRQQREEEKRKAEEAAAKINPLPNGSPGYASERENGVSLAVTDVSEKSANSISNSSTTGVVNGDLSGQNLKKDEKTTSMFSTEKGEVSDLEASGIGEHQAYENKQQVKL